MRYPLSVSTVVVFAQLLTGTLHAADLDLLAAYPISGPENIQPSGLAYCGSRLLMISDKHDDQIFELVPKQDEYEALRFQGIVPPETQDTDFPLGYRVTTWFSGQFFSSHYDWEDIACEGDGIFLLSEAEANVASIGPSGSRWIYPSSLYAPLHQAGFLNSSNAGLEGLAMKRGTIYLAMEREPRGIASIPLAGGVPTAARLTDSALPVPAQSTGKRSHDVTALLVHREHLYTLERNYAGVCRHDIDNFALERCWSFGFIEGDRRFRFGKMEYGLAEGMTVVGDALYIVYDTNGTSREIDMKDKRPLLFRFRIPSDW